jgi:hypothetical protein
LLAALLMTGCSPAKDRTFVGFTFGGGGNTFSAEPATLTLGQEVCSLDAGDAQDPVSIHLTWPSHETFDGQPLQLDKAMVTVQDRGGLTELHSGNIVLQAKQGSIGHGSFDLTTKHEDGREFKIVGSFTATIDP